MTTKLQKIWMPKIGTPVRSKDVAEILIKAGEQVEQGYFITAEQLKEVVYHSIRLSLSAYSMSSAYVEIKEQLGVEDD